MKDIVGGVLSIIASLLFVVTFVAFGWYVVWKLILCRFRFIRELLGTATRENSNSAVNDLKNGRSKLRKSRRD